MRYAFFILLTSLFFGQVDAHAASAKPEILKSSLPLPADLTQLHSIQILVASKQDKVSLSTKSSYRVMDESGRPLFSGAEFVAIPVTPYSEGIQIGSQRFPGREIYIEIPHGDFTIGKTVYPDSLKISKTDAGKLDVINVTSLEEYLKGVLPKEVDPRWNAEVLKAQAVAARTFAVFRILETRYDSYAVSSDVTSQVYGGKSAWTPETTAAVAATAGQILTYKGEVFPAFFHANSGGYTTSAENIWRIEPHPSLRGIESSFSKGTKHYRWTETISASEIEKIFKDRGYTIPGLEEIRVIGKDESGRAKKFGLKFKFNELKINAVDFRIFIGPFRFKSLLIDSIERTSEGFRFTGRGWGHGVGLCQYGAKNLADLGYNYRKILEYYYAYSQITLI